MIIYDNVIRVPNCLNCRHGKLTKDNLSITCADNNHRHAWDVIEMLKTFKVNPGCKVYKHAKIQ